MIPIDKVRDIISKHELLEKELSSNEIDKKNFAKKSKEYSDLNEILNSAKQYLSFYKTEKDLKKILDDSSSDKEIRNLAEAELEEIQGRIFIKTKTIILVSPKV